MRLKGHTHLCTILVLTMVLFVFSGYGCYDGCGTECDYDTCSEGPYDTIQNLRSGPRGDSGLFYPSSGNGPFPILVFGCGAGTNPDSYVDHGNYIASWGFIVVIETSSGDGTELTDAIDWLQIQNANSQSVLHQKCNLSKIAAGGHSLGSISTFAIAGDPRLTTTIHVAGGSFDGLGAFNLRKPAAYICGADDTLATPNAETDYDRTSVPVFMTVMDGVDHISAAREGLPAICAWMLWHLSGETERSSEFLTSSGVFQTGMWDSKSKNW